MYREEIIYPAYEDPTIKTSNTPILPIVLLIVFFVIIIPVIIFLILFFSGSCAASSVSSAVGGAANSKTAESSGVVKPQLKILGNTNTESIPGYINVKTNSYKVNTLSENKVNTLLECTKLCSDNKDCEGVKYHTETCVLFSSLPEVNYDGSTPNEVIYLKDDSRPIIADRVFVATQRSKLIEKEWWNLIGNTGETNVFTKNNNKSWYMTDSKYDVINHGRMSGVYSDKKLTDSQIKDLLDKDIHPNGVECIVDVPYADNYSLDLSKFVRKSIYITYI